MAQHETDPANLPPHGASAFANPEHAIPEHGEEVLEVVEETLRLDKREVVTGRVRVSTPIALVEEALRGELSSHTVEVTRVPIGREVAEAPEVRVEGDATVFPVLEERLVVTRVLVLVEEVRVRRVARTEVVEERATRRVQRVEVERSGEG